LEKNEGLLACISLALSGALIIPLIVVKNIMFLADIALLLLLILLIFGAKEDWKVSTLILAFLSIIFFELNLYYLSLTFVSAFIAASCLSTRDYRCIYSLFLLPLIIGSNNIERIVAMLATIALISLVSVKITKKTHSLLLLIAIPMFVLINFKYWSILEDSIAAGLLAATFSWPEKRCPFSKEPSLIGVGTFISLLSILAIILLKSSYYINTLIAFWEMGFLLQISGLMVPRTSATCPTEKAIEETEAFPAYHD